MSIYLHRCDELPLPVYRFAVYKQHPKVKPINRDRRSVIKAQNALAEHLAKFLKSHGKKMAEAIRKRNGDTLRKSLVDQLAHSAATSNNNSYATPTEAQAKAGNYRKAHINIGGLEISIENPAGTRRRPEWPPLRAHYGYVRRTVDNDGDHLDVFIKTGTSENYNGPVFVIDQQKADGTFDEHKAMIGWNTEIEARLAYTLSYAPGWKGLKAITQMSWGEFKRWCRRGDHTAPIAKALTTAQMLRVQELMEELNIGGFAVLAKDEEFKTLLATIAKDGGAVALAQIGIDDTDIVNLANERAEMYARERAAEMVGMRLTSDGDLIPNPNAEWRIDESTRDMVNSLVVRAEEEGWSNDRLADELEELGAFSEARAEMIARTETAYADASGSMAAYEESGVVTGKSWLLSANACDVCIENEAAGVIGLDEVFPSGDSYPPAHPNCRCDVIPEIETETEKLTKRFGKAIGIRN